MQNINKTPFINREKEIAYLQSWVSEAPNNILFLFGPKSSGKTTLLNKFIADNSSKKQFDIKHFNLREILLVNYEEADMGELLTKGIYSEQEITNELAELVRQNILAYNPVTALFSLQGKSLEIGLDMYIKRLA